MTVWRLQTRTSGDGQVAQYCLKNEIAVVGWGVSNGADESIAEFADYLRLAKSKYPKGVSSVKGLYSIQPGDLIWMRDHGKYYIGMVGEGTKWQYNNSNETAKHDAYNQITNVHWGSSPYADESIAGMVTTSFIRGQALQKIHKDGIKQYSRMTYNIWSNENIFDEKALRFSGEDKIKCFYNLLTTMECEDLVAFYLYSKKGYIGILSTNKLSTPLYEFVMLDPLDANKRIYIQVKKGNVDIDAEDFQELNGEVYVFTSEGKIINTDKKDLHIITPTELYDYAVSKNAVLSEGIKMWLKVLRAG